MPLPLYYFLANAAINVLMSWALYLPYRLAHLHFITVANMAISGYAAGYLVGTLHVPFGWALAVGFALGAVVGYLVSLAIGDAPTFAVVIVGFTFIYIVRTVIENLPAVGGTMGIFGLPSIGGNPVTHRWAMLAILFALLAVVGFLIHRFDHSRLGRAASAVFTDRELAASLGVDARRLGRLLQTFSCTIAGGCGVLYGFIYKSFHPDFFTFALVGIFMTVIFVGGYATQWGSLVLAPILYGVPLLLPPSVAAWRIVMYGAALVLVLVLKPEGFITRRFVHSVETTLFGEPKETLFQSRGGAFMKKGLIVLVAVFFAATLGFAQAGSAVKQWTIPFLDCLTGPIASIGEYLNWGAQRAAFEINAAGGIAGKPVNITAIDTANDPQKGSVAMAMIVANSLVAIGPVPEPVILAAMPIAVESGMMSITATTSYEYAVKFFPWTVSFLPPTEKRLGDVVIGWVGLHPGMKKVVQFLENYGAWPGMADAHTKALTGLKLATANVEVPTDAVTFGPLVVKALDQKPDGIIFACNPNKIGLMIKELKSRGWTSMGQLLVFSSGDAPELYQTGGSDINGVNIYNYIDPNANTPRFKAFSEAYSKDHGGTPAPSLSTNYYDAVYMIKEAIEKTGVTGDPKKLAAERKLIANYCANVKGFHGIMFDWDMKDGGPVNKPAYIFEIQNGEKKLLQLVRGN